MYILGPLLTFLSSLVSLIIIYEKIPTRNLQQIIALLLVLLLAILSRFLFASNSRLNTNWLASPLVFFSSLLVQLLVISSGGFYSPFLILIHLFTLGSSFLLNLPTAVTFLFFSVILLFLHIKLDPNILKLFNEDFWSAVLYFISFTVIVPLSFLLMRSYHIKDSLSKILSEHLQLGKLREESILSGLNELVVVTDINMRILYVNSAVEKELGHSGTELLHKYFLDVFPLKDSDGNPATVQSLSIDSALLDKAARMVNNFYFYGRGRTRVTIQIRPIGDLNGKLIQVVFVITEATSGSNYYQANSNIERARNKYLAMIDELRKNLPLNQYPDIRLKMELITKIEEDLLLAREIEDRPIKEKLTFQDVALLVKQVVVIKQNLAQSLKVPLEFRLPENETAEAVLLSLVETSASASATLPSDFLVPADFKWLGILVHKLIEICLLVALGETNSEVVVSLQRDNQSVIVEISCGCHTLTIDQQKALFIPYYADLGAKTTLRFGSGLEGVIAKTISDQLNLTLVVKSQANPAKLAFIINISKKPR